MMKSLIAVEARIFNPEIGGGISRVIISLAENLSQLDQGAEEYVFVAWDNAEGWLGKYIGGPCRLHMVAVPGSNGRPAGTPGSATHKSDGTIESLGADLVHFPMQNAYLTSCPSIYHPHDLQHVHMPEYFDADTLRWRLIVYRAYSYQAKFVCVETDWMKDDVVKKLDVPPDNVAVIPIAPPSLPSISMTSWAALAAAQMAGFARFIFYATQTWRHKNHFRLLEALQFLKQQEGLVIPLVCSGHQNEFFPEIQAKVSACRLEEQVRFLGFVARPS